MKNFQMKNKIILTNETVQSNYSNVRNNSTFKRKILQMKAKNLFSCHIFETHAYNRARAPYIYARAGCISGRLVSGLIKSAIKISGNA